MLSLQTGIAPKCFLPPCVVNVDQNSCSSLSIPFSSFSPSALSHLYQNLPSFIHCHRVLKTSPCFASSRKSDSKPDSDSDPEVILKPKSEAKRGSCKKKPAGSQNKDENHDKSFPIIIPKKPRRGRRSEAEAVEDFIRDKLEQTFESIRQQNPEAFEKKQNVMKERPENEVDSDSSSDEDEEEDNGVGRSRRNKMVVEEDDPDWPLDADVGWGIRASEYFEQHPIKNVVGDDGFEIDWEGEMDDSWVKEINCLEWESFAFHPSPLIVLVFERYNR